MNIFQRNKDMILPAINALLSLALVFTLLFIN
jgi:hypothetical protein